MEEMAGSYKHCVDERGFLLEEPLLDNLGDAFEAVEEMYDMIEFLTGGDKRKIWEAHLAHLKKRYPHFDEIAQINSFESYWET